MSDKQKLVSAILAGVLLILGAIGIFFGVPVGPTPLTDAGSPDVVFVPDTTQSVDTIVAPPDVSLPPPDIAVPQPDVLVVDTGSQPPTGGLITPDMINTIIPLDWSLFPSLPSFDTMAGQVVNGANLPSVVASAASGTVLKVSGDYTGPGFVINKPLTIVGVNQPTITFTSKNGIEIASNNVNLSNLNIVGGADVAIYFGKSGKNYVFDRLNISKTKEGGALWTGSGGTIDNLLLHLATFKDVTDTVFHCGTSAGCKNWRLENIVVQGIGNSGGWGNDGIAVEAGNNILIANVFVAGSGSDCIDIKATNAVVFGSHVENCMNNYYKLWKTSALINSSLLFTGINRSLQTVVQIDGDNTTAQIKGLIINYKDGVKKCPAPILGEAAGITLDISDSIIMFPCPGPIQTERTGTIKLNNNKFYFETIDREIIRINNVETYANEGFSKFGTGNVLLTEKPTL